MSLLVFLRVPLFQLGGVLRQVLLEVGLDAVDFLVAREHVVGVPAILRLMPTRLSPSSSSCFLVGSQEPGRYRQWLFQKGVMEAVRGRSVPRTTRVWPYRVVQGDVALVLVGLPRLELLLARLAVEALADERVRGERVLARVVQLPTTNEKRVIAPKPARPTQTTPNRERERHLDVLGAHGDDELRSENDLARHRLDVDDVGPLRVDRVHQLQHHLQLG